jgi:hypothetical protein
MVSKIPKYNAWYLKGKISEYWASKINRRWGRGWETDNTSRHAKKSERKPVIRVEACLIQDAGRLHYIFRNIHVILIFLLYIWFWKRFQEKHFISTNIFTSKCVGKLQQIPHNTPLINAAIVILLRHLNIISTGWIASFPSCPPPISEWPVCFPAVWFLVGMVIMGNKFRIGHPPLEWYTVFTLRTPSTIRTTILR